MRSMVSARTPATWPWPARQRAAAVAKVSSPTTAPHSPARTLAGTLTRRGGVVITTERTIARLGPGTSQSGNNQN